MNEREIFTNALKREAGDREVYLAQACGDDVALRKQVDALLAEHVQLGSFLESPPPAFARTVDDRPMARDPIALAPGTRIGPFKLIEQIGVGGMGVVYMAAQSHPVARKVALKLIKPGLDTRQVINRFDAERQALALMDHPNIAKVFDAGSTESGQPYFVMELVNGVPITEYCDSHRLTPRDRLELFLPVCQALQHAHQKGIIHRDLKPSNVLVTQYDAKPVPKVIDFGVAKATGPKLTEETLYTGFGALVGTLEYMSPEQAVQNQLDVDTRSDIYSLGVLLYELLTGSTPLDHKRANTAALLELLRIIKEEEPPKPSTRLSSTDELPSVAANRGLDPKKLSILVRGDLDWIVMKALEKDRTRRYETANALARDLQRHLADEVVEARPPSANYRLRKFVRRNRGLVVAVALITLALVGGVVGTTWGIIRAAARAEGERLAKLDADAQRIKAVAANEQAQKARDRAERRFELAVEAIGSFRSMVDGNLDVKNRPENETLRKAFLQAPLAYYQKLRDELRGGGDAGPEVRAQLAGAYLNLASLNREIGSQADALEAYDNATTLFERLFHEAPTAQIPRYRAQLARALGERGALQSVSKDQIAAAVDSLHRSQELQEAAIRENADDLNARKSLVLVLTNLAALEGRRGQVPSALDLLKMSRSVLEEGRRRAPEDVGLQTLLAEAHLQTCAILEEHRTQLKEAQASAQAAQQILEPLSLAHPDSVECRLQLSEAYMNLGRISQRQRAQDRAFELFAKQVATIDELVRLRPTRNGFKHSQAIALSELASAEYRLGRGEAMVNLQKATDLANVLVRDNPTNAAYKRTLSSLGLRRAYVLHSTGRTKEALAAEESSAALLEEILRAGREELGTLKDVAGVHYNCAILSRELGQLDRAEAEYARALDLRQRLAQQHPDDPWIAETVATTLANIGVCQEDRNHLTEARDTYEKAAILLQKLATAHPDDADTQNHFTRARQNLGKVLTKLGKPQEALVPLRAAQEASERLARSHPGVVEYEDDVARGWQCLAGALAKLARPTDAAQAYAQAIRTREQTFKAHPSDTHNFDKLFALFIERGDFERASNKATAAVASFQSAIKLIEGRSSVAADQLYDLAAVHAKLSTMARESGAGLKADDARAETDKAMASLNRAVSTGFRKVEQIRKDPDFDTLRNRDDFKKLLERLKSSGPASSAPAD